jgi:hypothetical protein
VLHSKCSRVKATAASSLEPARTRRRRWLSWFAPATMLGVSGFLNV